MGSNSNHHEDIAKWIESIIDSCETKTQLSVTKNLIQLFLKQVQKENSELHSHYSFHLNKCLHDKVIK